MASKDQGTAEVIRHALANEVPDQDRRQQLRLGLRQTLDRREPIQVHMSAGGDVIPDTVFRQMGLTAVDLVTEDRARVLAQGGRFNPHHAVPELTQHGDMRGANPQSRRCQQRRGAITDRSVREPGAVAGGDIERLKVALRHCVESRHLRFSHDRNSLLTRTPLVVAAIADRTAHRSVLARWRQRSPSLMRSSRPGSPLPNRACWQRAIDC